MILKWTVIDSADSETLHCSWNAEKKGINNFVFITANNTVQNLHSTIMPLGWIVAILWGFMWVFSGWKTSDTFLAAAII